MREARGASSPARSPGPFHCLVCKTMVTGTASGHCPRCSWIPPAAPAVEGAPPVIRALPVALVAIALIAALALFSVRCSLP